MSAHPRTSLSFQEQNNSERFVSERSASYALLNANPPRPIGNVKSLQGLRGIAAMLVVLFHTSHSIFGVEKYYNERPFGDLFEFGHAGVQFFFVLSGFIIYAAHRRDIGNQAKFGDFVWKRFRRVYPVYWVMLLLIIPIFFVIPSFGTGGERGLGVVFDSFTLVHLFGNGYQELTVSWTLFHEILFYGVFSILLLNRRIGWTIMGVWLAASVIGASNAANPTGIGFLFSSLHLLFGMGLAAACFVSHRVCRAPAIVALLGVTLFAAAATDEVRGGMLSADALNVIFGLGSMLILVGVVELERNGKLSIPRPFLFLGEASYSIYLVHFTALSALAKVAVLVTKHVMIPHTVVFIGLVVASTAAGIVYHLLVEVPLLALLGQWRPSRRKVKEALPAGQRVC